VPIEISTTPLAWSIAFDSLLGSLNLDTRKEVGLQASDSVNGPYVNVGVGQTFSFASDAIAQFYRGIKRLAGGIVGTVTDPAGKPLTGVSVGLPQGNRTASTDTAGGYSLQRLPFGDSIIQFLKMIPVADPNTGQTTTGTATIDILLPVIKSYGTLNFKVEMQVFKIPACNCTPWCSIGFGTADGTQTPIYFSGGANPPPKGVPSNCDAPTVTVTPPNGKTFTIKAGSAKHQNSGPNPAPGTWTVTTTVCGQSKSCSINFP
jgi:hypothetical protein